MRSKTLRAITRALAHASAGALTLADLPAWLKIGLWVVNGLGTELALALEPRKKAPPKLELPGG